MALDVDWAGSATNPYRILIPRADMPIVQASPEVRELDVDQFRKDLRTLEASVDGAPWPETHTHQTQSILSGTTFARQVEILAPYQIEFEDGQYSVRATGANHNILDRKVNNQVSLAVFLSSGLINSPELQIMAYEEQAVLVDPLLLLPGSTSGTTPLGTIGTRRRPVDNFSDALAIANAVGLSKLKVIGGTELSPIPIGSVDLRGFTIVGESETATFVDIQASAQVQGTEWRDMDVRGDFDGFAHIENCIVQDVNFIEGTVKRCRLRGTIQLAGTNQFSLLECLDDLSGLSVPVIDWNNADIEVIIRRYRGGLTCRNRSNAKGVSVDGVLRLTLESSFGGTGDVVVRGIGPFVDNQNSSPGFTLTEQMIAPDVAEQIANGVLDQPVSLHMTPGSVGETLNAAAYTPTAHVAVSYDDASNLLDVEVRGARGGVIVSPTGMSLTLVDPDGNTVYSATEVDATLVNGVYVIKDASVTLQPLTPYRANVSVTDATGTISNTRTIVTTA